MADGIKSAFERAAQSIEKEVGAPPGTVASVLYADSDWATVIKVHTFLEALISRLLTSALNEESLGATLARLPMVEDIAGKLAFAKAIGVLAPGERRFIKKLAELRNLLAHDPSNLGFSFKLYVDGLDKAQLKSLVTALLFESDDGEMFATVSAEIKSNPRLVFSQQLLGLLAVLMRRHRLVRVCHYLTPNERRIVFESIPLPNKTVEIIDGLVVIRHNGDENATVSFKPEHHRDCSVHDMPVDNSRA